MMNFLFLLRNAKPPIDRLSLLAAPVGSPQSSQLPPAITQPRSATADQLRLSQTAASMRSVWWRRRPANPRPGQGQPSAVPLAKLVRVHCVTAPREPREYL